MPRNCGDILLEQGVVDQKQLDAALSRSENSHVALLEQLIIENIASETEIAQALSLGLGLPLVYLTQLRIPGYVAKLIPREKALSIKVIPVSLKKEGEQEVLYVAFLDPTDSNSIEEVEQLVNKPVHKVVATLSDIENAIKRYNVKFPTSKKKTAQMATVVEEEKSPFESIETPEETFPEIAEEPEQIPEIPKISREEETASEPPTPKEIVETVEDKKAEDDELDFEIDFGFADELVPETPETENVVPETPQSEDLDFDDDFEIETVDEVPNGEKVAFQRNEINFEEEIEEPEKIEEETPETEEEIVNDPSASQQFLSINTDTLGESDDSIESSRDQARKVKQTHAWGVEDLEFKEEDDDLLDSTEEEEPSTQQEQQQKQDIDDDSLIEDFDTIDFDLDSEKDSSEKNKTAESSDKKNGSLEDEFDFDFGDAIPPAPTFESPPSTSQKIDTAATGAIDINFSDEFSFDELEQPEETTAPQTVEKKEPEPKKPEPKVQSDLEEVNKKIEDGVDFNFDDVVADLDRLLAGGCDISGDPNLTSTTDRLPIDLCTTLMEVADQAGEEISSHDVDQIYEIMIGRRPDAEDQRTIRLKELFKDKIQKWIDQL